MDVKDVKRLERHTMRDIALVMAGIIIGAAVVSWLYAASLTVDVLLLTAGLTMLTVAIRMKR